MKDGDNIHTTASDVQDLADYQKTMMICFRNCGICLGFFTILGDDDNDPVTIEDVQYFATIKEDDNKCFHSRRKQL